MLRVAVLFAVVFAVVTAGGGEVEKKNDEGGADSKRTYLYYEIFIFLKIQFSAQLELRGRNLFSINLEIPNKVFCPQFIVQRSIVLSQENC